MALHRLRGYMQWAEEVLCDKTRQSYNAQWEDALKQCGGVVWASRSRVKRVTECLFKGPTGTVYGVQIAREGTS